MRLIYFTTPEHFDVAVNPAQVTSVWANTTENDKTTIRTSDGKEFTVWGEMSDITNLLTEGVE